MPFTKTVLPVLPKPDNLVGSPQARQLSAIEDKELRKKLRNRQSALAARERKKARMLELERNVADLQQANKSLEEENAKLRNTLNAILRSASVTNVCGIYSNVGNGQRAILTTNVPVKTMQTVEKQVCGVLQASNARSVNHEYVAVKVNTRPGVPVVQQQDRSPELAKSVVVNSGDLYKNQEMTPIDYSVHADKGNERTKYATKETVVVRRTIKTENQENHTGVGHLSAHQPEICGIVSKESFKNPKVLAVAPGTIINIKREASDSLYECGTENNYDSAYNWQSTPVQNAPIAEHVADENNSLFAQAIKRSAQAMLLSTRQYSPVVDNNSTMQLSNNTPPMKLQGKRKQALPSIDAVFNSPPKVSRVNYSDKGQPELPDCATQTANAEMPLLQRSQHSEGDNTCQSTPSHMGSDIPEEEPLSLVKFSDHNKCKRDPYLHGSECSQKTSFDSNESKQLYGFGEDQLGLITNDLSAMIDNYSTGSAVETDDVLVGLYDSSAGNSPLESVCSRDSGLGIEDSPLDWISDTSIFDFQ